MNELEELKGIVRRFEGLRLRAYLCPANVWTIGYGATGKDIGPGVEWTEAQAENRLEADCLAFLNGTRKLCPKAQGGNLVALADFAYNLGLGRLASSTLRRKFNAGDISGSKVELLKWDRGGGRVLPGLVARRKIEAGLMRPISPILSAVEESKVPDVEVLDSGTVIVGPPPLDPSLYPTPTLLSRAKSALSLIKLLWAGFRN